jgi:CubicO group peptidase (beta-lactamase class C family)
MDRHRQHASSQAFGAPWQARALSRRTLLQGAAATGLGAAAATLIGRSGPSARAAAPVTAQAPAWRSFDDAVGAAMRTFDMVGAAVAVVSAAGMIHSQTFGVRDRASGAPVTPSTLFRVGSTTKSMTALLLATFVDEGLLGWDQPVIDIWPDFRAPTAELTRTLRVRDLMGMDSGLGEPPATELHFGEPDALGLLRSIAFLPVLGPPHTQFFYNNTVCAAGGYLPSMRQGTAAEELQAAYARLMQARVFGPAGMDRARIADDPRPYTDDYATGYAPDFFEEIAGVRWASIGSFAPAGGTLASLTDMAAYVRLQLRRGVAAAGGRVVSARNLEACWQPHIDLPTDPSVLPDLTGSGYAMGWMDQTYTGGRRLVRHTGGIDGFSTFIGFFPEDDLGLVVLTNTLGGLYARPDAGAAADEGSAPYTAGASVFPGYVLNLLLEDRFGLNRGVNETLVGMYRESARQLAALAARAGPVDAGAILSYLGHYERGYRLAFDAAGALRLHVGSRSIRLLALPDGSYVGAGGWLVGTPVRFSRDPAGVPTMELEGLETVRWLSGPP